jgi:4-hydroxy-tetrahydrodipicolinate synthase
MNRHRLTGMIAPMVVPFDGRGELDEAAFRREAHYLINRPIDGISSGGSTGEGVTLSDGELRRCSRSSARRTPAGCRCTLVYPQLHPRCDPGRAGRQGGRRGRAAG